MPFLASDLLQMRGAEPNDKLEQAQGLPIPCGVSGRIDKPRDVDYYTFHGHKGESLNFEIKARTTSAPSGIPRRFRAGHLGCKGQGIGHERR